MPWCIVPYAGHKPNLEMMFLILMIDLSPRCADYPNLPPQCVLVTDPKDSCCKVPYCDYVNPTPFPHGIPTSAPQPTPSPRPGQPTPSPGPTIAPVAGMKRVLILVNFSLRVCIRYNLKMYARLQRLVRIFMYFLSSNKWIIKCG